MRIVLLIIVLLSCVSFLSQTKKEQKLLDKYAYYKLSKKLEKKSEKDSLNNEELKTVAKLYLQVGKNEESFTILESLYLQGDTVGFDKEVWNSIVQGYISRNKRKEAFRIIVDHPNEMAGFKFNVKDEDSKLYNTNQINLLNSENADFAPFVVDSILYFTSDRGEKLDWGGVSDWTGTSYLSIYQSEIDWQDNEPVFSRSKAAMKKVNEKYHTSNLSYSKTLQSYLFTKVNADNKGLNHAQVYFLKKEGKKWIEIPFTYNNLNYSVAHAVFIDSLSLLVFSSDMPGGRGGMDLYYSNYHEGKWQAPVNFGKLVNTPFDEVFPTYNYKFFEGIVFSTNGRGAYGYFDLYQFNFRNDTVKDVEVLLPPLNSEYDDLSMTFINENVGVFSSNRNGSDDLFYFSPKLTKITGKIINDSTEVPEPGVKLYLFDQDGFVKDSTYTNNEGRFEFKQLPKENYGIIPLNPDSTHLSLRQNTTGPRRTSSNFITLMNQNNQITDTISLYEEDLTLLLSREYIRDLCYTTEGKSVIPKLEAKVVNGKVELVKAEFPDECFDLKKLRNTQNLTVPANQEIAIDSSSLKFIKRCVVYSDGTIASNVHFIIEEDQMILDTLKTDQNGCFKLNKLYPSHSMLTLEEEDLWLIPRPNSREKSANLYAEEVLVIEKIARKCAVYEDGGNAGNILFVIEENGVAIDTVSTNSEGCIILKRLYSANALITPLEEDVSMIIKGRENVLSNSDVIIVVASGRKCAVYEDGSKADNITLLVKSGNFVVDTLITDADGCFRLKKKYPENSYLTAEEEFVEMIVRDQGSKKEVLVSELEDVVTVSINKKLCAIFEDDSKAENIRLIISNGDFVLDTLTTDENGCIKLKKLYPDGSLISPDEEDVALSYRKKSNNLVNEADVIILQKAQTKCVEYTDGRVGRKIKFFIEEGHLIIDTLETNDAGCMKFTKLYSDNAFIIPAEEDVSLVPRMKNGKMTSNYSVNDDDMILIKEVKAVATDVNTVSKEDSILVFEVYFDYNKSTIRSESEDNLNGLVKLLDQNQDLTVLIKAHTDSRGSSSYNLKLSNERAQSVMGYLISKGVSASKLESKGYGESELLNDCSDDVECPESMHEKNRRVEFVLNW